MRTVAEPVLFFVAKSTGRFRRCARLLGCAGLAAKCGEDFNLGFDVCRGVGFEEQGGRAVGAFFYPPIDRFL